MNHAHFAAFSEGTSGVRDFMQISFCPTKGKLHGHEIHLDVSLNI